MLKNGIKTAHNKSLKRSYKNLDKAEYRVMKIIEAKEAAERYLYGYLGFYTTAPRLTNQQVDFSQIENSQIVAFENANKAIEKFNKIEDEVVKAVQSKFYSSQFSYSQSY